MSLTLSFVIGQAVIGIVIAEFLGGLVHWFQQRILPEDFPIIGHLATLGNEHHYDAGAFLDRSPFHSAFSSGIVTLIFSLSWIMLAGFSIAWVFATIGGLMSAQVHRWAHSPRTAPRAVSILQESGIIQGARQHSMHHGRPSTNYCALTNFMNPILDGVGFWDKLERLLRMKKETA